MVTVDRKPPRTRPARLLVLVSGGGTNLQAIIDAIAAERIRNAEITAVISNNAKAYALERARRHGLPAICLPPGEFADRASFDAALLREITALEPDLIVTCGFLLKLPAATVSAYTGRIINIHPSLIPAFCGAGCYGLAVHEMALARGVKITGATVHFIDHGLDTGPIIAQKAVEVRPGDTAETLQKRVMEEAEWVILPQAIDYLLNVGGDI